MLFVVPELEAGCVFFLLTAYPGCVENIYTQLELADVT